MKTKHGRTLFSRENITARNRRDGIVRRRKFVEAAARAAGFEVSPTASRQIADYLDLLLERGMQFDLIADVDESLLIKRHVVDSMSLLGILPARALQIIDVGSGAGFPGVVLSIVRPQDRVALLEAREARAQFLREVVQGGRLSARVIQGRAEELGRRQLRECYDVAVARALGSPPEALELILPLVGVGGMGVLMAGPSGRPVLGEIDRISETLGGRVGGWLEVGLSEERERLVIWVHKVEPTADRFPRRAARIRREARAWEAKVGWSAFREVQERGREG